MGGSTIQGERKVSVSRTIAAEPSAVFAVLTDPAQHSVIDGSGTVRQPRGNPERLELGSKFAMDMKMGLPYVIRNTVVEYEPDRLIAWRHWGGHRWHRDLRLVHRRHPQGHRADGVAEPPPGLHGEDPRTPRPPRHHG